MRKFFALTFALALLGGTQAFAEWPGVVDAQTGAMPKLVIPVFNDSGTTLVSGAVVVWDTADTDLVADFSPYVTTTTTVDDPATAGVMESPTCADQTVCSMVVYGFALVRTADATDNISINTFVGASGVAQLAGDYSSAADKKVLGLALSSGNGTEYEYIPVFVNTLGSGP